VLAWLELDLLVETDRRTTRRISFALQQEQIVVLAEASKRQDVTAQHGFTRRFAPRPVDENGNFHLLLSCVSLLERAFYCSIGLMMLQDPNIVATLQQMGPSFDDATFFEMLERRRQAENLSWRQLGRQLGLSPSTFSRLARGRRPDIETFIKLLAWLDVPAATFMRGEPQTSTESPGQDTLTVIADALQSDPAIPKDAAGALEQLLRVAYSRVTAPADSPPTGSSDPATIEER
jgi:transcriptional regulator with XRE-family HTH domain